MSRKSKYPFKNMDVGDVTTFKMQPGVDKYRKIYLACRAYERRTGRRYHTHFIGACGKFETIIERIQ